MIISPQQEQNRNSYASQQPTIKKIILQQTKEQREKRHTMLRSLYPLIAFQTFYSFKETQSEQMNKRQKFCPKTPTKGRDFIQIEKRQFKPNKLVANKFTLKKKE